MSWRTSTEIGLSELAANSVFSVGGAGGLALGAWILRRGGLPAAYIARRTVAFFLLTSLANVGFLALGGHRAGDRHPARLAEPLLGLIPAVAGALAIALALGARRLAGVLARRWMQSPARRGGARRSATASTRRCGCCGRGDPAILVGAAGYMLFDVAMLGVCFAAFGNDVPPVGVLLVAYLIGQLGSLIPIPGGIGGVDGGLIGDARALRRGRGRRRRRGDRLPRAAAGRSRRCSACPRSRSCGGGCATRRTTSPPARPGSRSRCSAAASCERPEPAVPVG